MAGVSAGAPLLALKLSSTLLFSAATGMLLIMNKIQPSQLAVFFPSLIFFTSSSY
jgi:hypothetical protein